MTKTQRYMLEMFVRVRDYGTANKALFPEASTGGETFARVTASVAAIDDHLTNRVVAEAAARKVKAATRKGVFDDMKTLALAARRVTRLESGLNPFRLPKRRSLKAEIAAARAFLQEAETRQDQFLRLGLPPTFASDFRTQVDALQQAVDVRLNSKTARRKAAAGIRAAFVEGLEAVRDLDAIVAIATRQHPVPFASWQSARRIEGQSSASAKAPTPTAVMTPGNQGSEPGATL